MALPVEWAWLEDLIAEEGRAFTLTPPGTLQDTDKPWRGNKAGTADNEIGVFVRYKSREVDGDEIRRGDQKVLTIPSENIDIEDGTKLVDSLDSSSWHVVNVEKITSGSDILLYILQIRQ